MLTNKVLSIGLGAAFAAAFLLSLPKTVEAMSGLKNRQITANHALEEWREAYQALLPVNTVWENTFVSASQIADLVHLYRAFRFDQYGLFVDPDTTMQTSTESVSVNGVEVGVRKLCVGSAGAQVLAVHAPSVGELRVGIKALSERNDISLGQMTMQFDAQTGRPIVNISDACLVVRVDAESGEI